MKIETIEITVPGWKSQLFISLFNTDGGEGFTDKVIAEAEQFIREHRILSLVEVSEPVDDEAKCIFLLSDMEPDQL